MRCFPQGMRVKRLSRRLLNPYSLPACSTDICRQDGNMRIFWEYCLNHIGHASTSKDFMLKEFCWHLSLQISSGLGKRQLTMPKRSISPTAVGLIVVGLLQRENWYCWNTWEIHSHVKCPKKEDAIFAIDAHVGSVQSISGNYGWMWSCTEIQGCVVLAT